MQQRLKAIFIDFCRGIPALVLTVWAIRLFEYFLVAAKSFINHPILYELGGWIYDLWACLIYVSVHFIPFLLLSLLSKKAAKLFFHLLNVLVLVIYLALIIVFSERNIPFDHEMFTRSFSESILTTKQMMTSGWLLYLPFAGYIALYFSLYFGFSNKLSNLNQQWKLWATGMLLSLLCINYANPSVNWFLQKKANYFMANKFAYWVADSYHYFSGRNAFDAANLTEKELSDAIDFYQHNQPFTFVSKEYPLMHENNGKDVLGGFFQLSPTQPPNIVILVVEGLSRDFSGDKAYAGSFTPFLDSLSHKSLAWDNFLSTAPGTFAAHPAIEGSLPYGKRGFSLINDMPDHLSLIKILRANGYHSKFLIGFNPDFDNMGGFMRLQGTDMILSQYGSKYKEMGVGEEGWSMGYPDDALFNRSFEVMDSLRKTPYLNIYHTGTTHMPYLFAQQHKYAKKFDRKMATIPSSSKVKRTLIESKKVLVTYMFADDCIRDFFSKYAKRPDFANTIFFITGDHHIGSFPSTCGIDDYHVPLIVYSPMLKTPRKFYAVNSHNNLAPTIISLVLNNYPSLRHRPREVHWLADVMDTCARFRNIQSMPFMEWSRDITDYIYRDYYLSGNDLYRITPDLLEENVTNDSVKNHMIALRDNFRVINSYVCANNKVFPATKMLDGRNRELLLDFTQPETRTVFTQSSDTSLMPQIRIPAKYKYLYVELGAEINLLRPGTEDQPSFRLSMIDTSRQRRNFVFWTHHNIVQMTKDDYVEKTWNPVSTHDMFTLSDYRKYHNLVFDLSFYAQALPINLQLRNLKIRLYGVK